MLHMLLLYYPCMLVSREGSGGGTPWKIQTYAYSHSKIKETKSPLDAHLLWNSFKDHHKTRKLKEVCLLNLYVKIATHDLHTNLAYFIHLHFPRLWLQSVACYRKFGGISSDDISY